MNTLQTISQAVHTAAQDVLDEVPWFREYSTITAITYRARIAFRNDPMLRHSVLAKLVEKLFDPRHDIHAVVQDIHHHTASAVA